MLTARKAGKAPKSPSICKLVRRFEKGMQRALALAHLRSLAVLGTAAVLVAGCAASTSTHHAASQGGVVTFAEAPASPPNYISPMEGGAYGNNDRYQFSNLLYLPLYTYGSPTDPLGLNRSLSIADPPTFSDHNTVVTVTMKHWVWSNGQPITARDVVFWLNLVSAASDPLAPTIGSTGAPGPGWAYAVPGAFPQNITSYSATGTYTLVLHLNRSYNPAWYTQEELTQLFPLPQTSWDRLTAPGPVGDYDTSAQTLIPAPAKAGLPADSYIPAHPGTATSGALGVAQFINSQSQDLGTYTTNPLWKVVDGPFKLAAFTASGYVKMTPNRSFSGSPKPRISAFVELPYTSDTAEFNALRSGGLTIGYIPFADLATQKAFLEKSEHYKLSPWNVSALNLIPLDYTNAAVAPMFNQLYFRQALQSLINQPEYIKDFADGIGTLDNGVVPLIPPHNQYVSSLEGHGLVYPYSPSRAVALLRSHGWSVQPGGTTVCTRPGSTSSECGPGIKAGQAAAFKLEYVSGSTQLTNEMAAMQSVMKSKAGIDVSLSQGPFSQIISIGSGCFPATPCSWDVIDWGSTATWTFDVPFPAGAQVFNEEGANAGDWVSSQNLANIQATETAPTQSAEVAAIYRYEDYVAKQIPFLLFPVGPAQLTMYKSNLKGLVTQNLFDEIFPQYYSF